MDQPESGGPDNPNLNSSPRNVSYVEPAILMRYLLRSGRKSRQLFAKALNST